MYKYTGPFHILYQNKQYHVLYETEIHKEKEAETRRKEYKKRIMDFVSGSNFERQSIILLGLGGRGLKTQSCLKI